MPGLFKALAVLTAHVALAAAVTLFMAVMLLHSAGAKFRGRVMGVRMLAIYGLPIGLLGAGWLIERIGYVTMATSYCTFGILATLWIGLRWHTALWPKTAPANAR